MIQNHILIEAEQQILPGGRPLPIRRCVVIHFTAGATAQSSIDYWKEREQRRIDLGAHIIIDRDGKVIQCRAFDKTISHAGVSRWVDPNTGKRYTNLNQWAIGIELANAGNDDRVIKIASRLRGYAGTVQARHRNGGGIQTWEMFPLAQVSACHTVVEQLVKRYNLDDITGHDCIAPERKDDPGPAFPMERIRKELGFKGLPVVHRP